MVVRLMSLFSKSQTIREDLLNKRFGEDWARLTRDLLFDGEGSLKIKTDLWSDIRNVILPMMVQQVRHCLTAGTTS
jgi:hypothetical protein